MIDITTLKVGDRVLYQVDRYRIDFSQEKRDRYRHFGEILEISSSGFLVRYVLGGPLWHELDKPPRDLYIDYSAERGGNPFDLNDIERTETE